MLQLKNLSDRIHTLLDAASFVSLVGDGIELVSGILYIAEDDWSNSELATTSAGSQEGKVIVKMSGTTTTRITTPAVTASSNHVTTTAGKTTTSKQVGTPAVVATGSIKTTNTGTSATRITTPAVVAEHVTTPSHSTITKKVGTPTVTAYTAANAGNRTMGTPAVVNDNDSLQALRGIQTKNLATPKITREEGSSDVLHTLLDMSGLVPFVGDWADLANGVLYVAEDDLSNAEISFLSMASGFDGASSPRLATNTTKIATEFAVKAARNVGGTAIGTTMATQLIKYSAQEVAETSADSVEDMIRRFLDEGGSCSL